MHVSDTSSEVGYYLAYYYEPGRKGIRPPPTVTDMPLDDNFDAATVARDSTVYRGVWAGDDAGSAAALDDEKTARRREMLEDVYSGNIRVRRNSECLPIKNDHGGQMVVGSGRGYRGKSKTRDGGGSDRGGKVGRVRSAWGGSQGTAELVEHRVLEDGPTRTITVWREQVASTSAEDDVTRIELDVQSRRHGHTRALSGNVSQSSESVRSRESSRDIGKNGRSSLERSLPRSPLQRTIRESPNLLEENGRFSPITQQRAMSPRGHASGSLPSARHMSPSTTRSENRGADYSGSPKSASVSTLELLLSSCQPPLVHLAQTFESIGIRKEEHLRAIIKMNDETRDREIKEEALKNGVTVVEWAIFLDKLRNLYSYMDTYT